jgi:hypothetical protein
MKSKTILITISVAIVFFIFGSLYWECCRPKYFIDTTAISDGEYIRIAKTTLEAEKFLEKYPNAQIVVDRSGALAVDFRIDSPEINDIRYLRLRVFINPRNYKPAEKLIDCSGNYIKQNLIEYLQTEKCLK